MIVSNLSRLRIKSVATLCLAMFYATSAHAEILRVKPYLQQPSTEGMYFTWFTQENVSSELVIQGPGLDNPLVYTITPSYESILNYTQAEKNESIEGLPAGSWLQGERNYKHVQDVRGLEPGSSYTYSVFIEGEEFTDTFTTAPQDDDWDSIRFMVLSDSETEPEGRIKRRDWQQGALASESQNRPDPKDSAWVERFGSTGSRLLYMLTETEGYQANLDIINQRKPDFLMMPGDLVQGGGYQPGWDEFFRHNAGEYANGLSRYPLLPAIGNWENYGALNGGYGHDEEGRYGPKLGRDKYHTYFDAPPNGTAAHQDNYYRIDYGPLTLITLDSSNGEPDDHRDNYSESNQAPKLSGRDYTTPGTDTQENIAREQYENEGGEDLADFNPGSIQWQWAQEQLKQAKARGQLIFVQFHHAPFSSGTHGFPMNHGMSSGQGGTPMRQYHDMFETYGVVAVFSGHSEMFERSFVDADQDGTGVHYYDVGVAGDGLRGQAQDEQGQLVAYNSFSQWTADQDEKELWHRYENTLQLISGGKQYGHLEVNIERVTQGQESEAIITFTPVHAFPVFDNDYQWVRTERRVLNDVLQLQLRLAL